MYETWWVWEREGEEGGGALWENERAICQHGNTSKSHRNARSPCSTGRIKPHRECVRAPCIPCREFTESQAHTHALKNRAPTDCCCRCQQLGHRLPVIALLYNCDKAFCLSSLMIIPLIKPLKVEGWHACWSLCVCVCVSGSEFVLYCMSLAHCLTQR